MFGDRVGTGSIRRNWKQGNMSVWGDKMKTWVLDHTVFEGLAGHLVSKERYLEMSD